MLEDLLFHCQQAAEKALKGFLVWHSRPFQKTHSLEEIGELCLAIDPILREVIDPLVRPTQYARELRYPADPEEYTREEADEAPALAGSALQTLLARLHEEIRS
ncbi:MAG: HEPN domain-containing protein [Acidobacteria bacterium]|nr:HEPN domain-containing protein [Acidobacteriota bacterium]